MRSTETMKVHYYLIESYQYHIPFHNFVFRINEFIFFKPKYLDRQP